MKTILSVLVKTYSLTCLLPLLIVSCQQEKKFDKQGWAKYGDVGMYPNREAMVSDLMKNHTLKGLHYSELLDKLGQPNSIDASGNLVYYTVMTTYNNDIDPTGSTTLEFKFNKDSIISGFSLLNTGH